VLPFGAITLIADGRVMAHMTHGLPFYLGWKKDHADWTPISETYVELQQQGFWPVFTLYFDAWSPVVMGYIVFALFGATQDTRSLYQRGLRRFFRSASSSEATPEITTIAFEQRTVDITDIERGCVDNKPICAWLETYGQIGIDPARAK
jgi:hypothetical protein